MVPLNDAVAGPPEPAEDKDAELARKVQKIANERLRRDIESAERWEKEIKEATGEK